jgi:hypothetical protein
MLGLITRRVYLHHLGNTVYMENVRLTNSLHNGS